MHSFTHWETELIPVLCSTLPLNVLFSFDHKYSTAGELQVTHRPELTDWCWKITECVPSYPSQSPWASDERSRV